VLKKTPAVILAITTVVFALPLQSAAQSSTSPQSAQAPPPTSVEESAAVPETAQPPSNDLDVRCVPTASTVTIGALSRVQTLPATAPPIVTPTPPFAFYNPAVAPTPQLTVYTPPNAANPSLTFYTPWGQMTTPGSTPSILSGASTTSGVAPSCPAGTQPETTVR
jgi:hypothetical protein